MAQTVYSFLKKNEHEIIKTKEDSWRKLVHAYLATSSYADYNVGRILKALEESAYATNTIVILWGDHGWHLGEKQKYGKTQLWQESCRVPLMVKVPGVTPKNKKSMEK